MYTKLFYFYLFSWRLS